MEYGKYSNDLYELQVVSCLSERGRPCTTQTFLLQPSGSPSHPQQPLCI